MQKTILLLLFILASIPLRSQTFRLGFMSGVNVTKLGDGDANAYNYLGYKLGGRMAVDVRRQVRTSIDFLYSKEGNLISHGFNSFQKYTNVTLHYVDVPFTITLMDWMDDPDEQDYYRLHFTFGMSYARLARFKASDNLDNDVTDEQLFNNNKWGLLGGLVYYPSEHVGINLQYAHSLTNVEKLSSSPNSKIRNWSLSVIYMLNNKRKSK